MKTFFSYTLVLSIFAWSSLDHVMAQCPTCSPDLNCISGDGLPAVCPTELPPATAGVYYEDYLTFYLPANVTDPESGIEATLEEIQITSVTGLPYGMNFTMNDPDNTYYPGEGENHGCATICGTPILEGIYDIVITVHVLAVAFGFEIEQNQQFIFNFVVNPGEVGNASFAMTGGPAACGQLTVQCEALIDGAPSITSWDWNFGNGETSTEQYPGPITYTQAGDYNISLVTTISDFILTQVSCSGLDDNWSGDIDDLFSDSDTFFILYDGNGNAVYTSGTIDNNNSPSWNGFSVVLNNPPYTISFTDDDDLSQDDNLGTASLSLEEGADFFDSGTGTVGQSSVGLQVSSTFTNDELVSVFPIPDALFNVIDNTLSYDDPELSVFVWMINGTPIEGEYGPTYEMISGGLYSCLVTNIYGCSATSEEYLYCPSITPQYDDLAHVVFVEDIYDSYQWFFNGLSIDGANEASVDASIPGNYAVEITTDYGCSTESSVLTVYVGLSELSSWEFSLWPNPVNDVLYYKSNAAGQADICIFDRFGRLVLTFFKLSAERGQLDLITLVPGVYEVEFTIGGKRKTAKIVRK